MRLLKCRPGDDGFVLTTLDDNHGLPYAVLSHAWTVEQEVTYEELLEGTGTNKSGYAKFRLCGEHATADSLRLTPVASIRPQATSCARRLTLCSASTSALPVATYI
ncbi:hypothetical protein CC86DRAFT_374176 [Ophiobolus disseminans]|uniref:Uncharacterized protein n=1 Tax=Ophiobolus disseminans TaxID=1469910 RepID=A0A6A6ZJS9_9PLEO|nr:hypothetical protein CC86DRAFT_374176 [Ophiobolus disseminans]